MKEMLKQLLREVLRGIVFGFTISAVLGASCALLPIRGVEEEFEPYVQRFKAEGLKYNVDISDKRIIISLIELEQPTVGQCRKSLFLPPIVVIDKFFWAWANDTEKEMLVFHELAHCLLGQMDHRMGKTLMTPFMAYEFNYRKERDYYLKEMFTYENK